MKRIYLLVGILAVFAISWGFISLSETNADDATEPCFYGTTYVDGQATGNVAVNLQIGEEDPITIYSESDGSYAIGLRRMIGDYCLRGRTTSGFPVKGDTYQGTKSAQGPIQQHLYCTGTFSECEGTQP